MQKLQSTIDYAFKLCGSIGLFFSFTEVRIYELFYIPYVFDMCSLKKCNVKCLKALHLFNCFTLLEITVIYLVSINLWTHCSLLVFGWPCDTGIRKIHELILVLSSSLTPSPCPLSPHMILLIDGGWFHVVIFYFIYQFLRGYFLSATFYV